MGELETFSARWHARSPGCRPVGHELRRHAPARWVRFHSLPRAKRYPETDDETTELLHRHNVVLADLLALDQANTALGPSRVHVITCSWSGSQEPTPRDIALTQVVPDAQHWQSVALGDPDVDSWAHLWHSTRAWTPGALDALLELVGNDATGGVIIIEPDCRWLYHPYDGGADVIAPTTAMRDRLAARHASWLSSRPDGL